MDVNYLMPLGFMGSRFLTPLRVHGFDCPLLIMGGSVEDVI
jgi:hypothetical protein